ncbi:unnamed protein product [Nezara viridula]|uniref:Major facilitator superfamily (MFS) profile domain-containing protein n=1 Tax=Nezara viridula TaxID=85310 RepID=A0A9P0H8H8_NEZVI|nr:unnamed protein product [Nezara viridula]
MDAASIRQHLASLSCSLAVAMTGTAFVWFAPLMMFIVSENSPIPMTTTESSWLVSSIEFGEIIAVLPSGILADVFGRKSLILATGPVCAATFIFKVYVRSLTLMYVLRFLQGVCMGVAYAVCPIYIAEIAEPRLRGGASSHFQTLWYGGALFAYCVGPYVSYQSYAWICLTIPLLFTATFFLMPESPYYLLMKGRKDEAKRALTWLRAGKEVNEEFKAMEDTIEKEYLCKGSWKELFNTKKDRKAFIIVQVCCITKYMNGMSALVTYLSQTFGESSSQYLGHNELTIVVGVLLTVVTLSSSVMSDKIGRRPMLMFSSLGCSLFLLVIGGYYFLEFETDFDVSGYVWILYLSMLGYIIVANVGLGPLMQTIQAEFFSSRTRGIGGGLTLIVGSLGAFCCIKQYQLVQDTVGVFLNYWIYAIVCLVGAVSIFFYLPETAGRSLGEIQKDMSKQEEYMIVNGPENDEFVS